MVSCKHNMGMVKMVLLDERRKTSIKHNSHTYIGIYALAINVMCGFNIQCATTHVYLTTLYIETLHLSYMLQGQQLHCYTEGRAKQAHLAKMTFQGTICERLNITCHALSEL